MAAPTRPTDHGHRVETCKLPSLWFRRDGSVWVCWCGKVYRKTSGCAGDSCIDEWEYVGWLNKDA